MSCTAVATDPGRSSLQLTTVFSNPSETTWIGNYAGNTWAGPDNFVAAWMDANNDTVLDVVGGIRLK